MYLILTQLINIRSLQVVILIQIPSDLDPPNHVSHFTLMFLLFWGRGGVVYRKWFKIILIMSAGKMQL